jgi:acyl-CoA thioesterase
MADPPPIADPPVADPQSIADDVGTGMYERDRAAQALGITVEAIGPGLARCRMIVRDDMVQGHATCHGGLTFTLADTAFAYACNAYNRATVALGAEIAFLAPARAGDTLSATARERSRSGRTSV